MSFYHSQMVEDVEVLAEPKFATIPVASLPACKRIFKLFVACLAGLAAVSLYRRGTAYSHATGFAEKVSASEFEKLNAVKKANLKHIMAGIVP
jgi:hypothetical protein